MSVLVEFNVINVNNLADNALLFNGDNQVFGWSSHIKQNHPLFISGQKSLFTKNYNILMDKDVLDYFVYDQDTTTGTVIEGF